MDKTFYVCQKFSIQHFTYMQKPVNIMSVSWQQDEFNMKIKNYLGYCIFYKSVNCDDKFNTGQKSAL